MNGDVIAIRRDERRHDEIVRRGFTRQPLAFDMAVAQALAQLSYAAWQLPRDQYYTGGDRFR